MHNYKFITKYVHTFFGWFLKVKHKKLEIKKNYKNSRTSSIYYTVTFFGKLKKYIIYFEYWRLVILCQKFEKFIFSTHSTSFREISWNSIQVDFKRIRTKSVHLLKFYPTTFWKNRKFLYFVDFNLKGIPIFQKLLRIPEELFSVWLGK